jgi:hypothetical protein
VLERWLTGRCWREDAPGLTTARGAIVKFLEQQDQRASGTDAHEWAQAIYGALETWETSSAQLAAGEKISYPAALHLELSKDTDDIWTLVIRRRLAYLHTGAEQRERWLTNGEIHAIFRHLAGQPDEDDYEFENPPHPQAFLFTQVHFLNGPITPSQWLTQISDQAATGKHPALVT